MAPYMGYVRSLLIVLGVLAGAPLAAQDANVTRPVPELERLLQGEPLVIESAEISRPKAKGDITLKADVSFGGAPALRVKLRKAEPGAEEFNNVPRYDLAAYELQKLLMEPAEYVVPPTALRMVPLADFRQAAEKAAEKLGLTSLDVQRTFPPADQVLAVVQYWLSDIKVLADVYDEAMFKADPVYARHIGQLNVLTHLIQHRDSNAGNFLIGRAERGPRLFSIDHGVAFSSDDSDRGELWKDMRVTVLPADTVSRLRAMTPDVLEQKLAVLAQWRLQNRQWSPDTPGENLSPRRGVRRKGEKLQMGLTMMELQAIERIRGKLLERIDRGEIKITTDGAPSG